MRPSSSTADMILDAAEVRMRKGGYNAVSFRELAADVNVKSASVHYHFPTKERLGVVLIERYRERFLDDLNEAAHDAHTPRDRLRAFFRIYRAGLTSTKAVCLCGMLGAESQGLPGPVAEAVQSFFRSNIEWLSTELKALSRGAPDEAATAIVAGLQGAMIIASSLTDIAFYDATEASLIRTYCN